MTRLVWGNKTSCFVSKSLDEETNERNAAKEVVRFFCNFTASVASPLCPLSTNSELGFSFSGCFFFHPGEKPAGWQSWELDVGEGRRAGFQKKKNENAVISCAAPVKLLPSSKAAINRPSSPCGPGRIPRLAFQEGGWHLAQARCHPTPPPLRACLAA